ncbi:hypothetical protein D3C81_2226820 [compost metagenome]
MGPKWEVFRSVPYHWGRGWKIQFRNIAVVVALAIKKHQGSCYAHKRDELKGVVQSSFIGQHSSE